MKTLRIFTMFALSCALLSCGKEKNGGGVTFLSFRHQR